jgi:hypothetical protein
VKVEFKSKEETEIVQTGSPPIFISVGNKILVPKCKNIKGNGNSSDRKCLGSLRFLGLKLILWQLPVQMKMGPEKCGQLKSPGGPRRLGLANRNRK